MQFLLHLLPAIEGQPMVLESRTTLANVHGLFNSGVPRACSGKDKARQTQQVPVDAFKRRVDAQRQVPKVRVESHNCYHFDSGSRSIGEG